MQVEIVYFVLHQFIYVLSMDSQLLKIIQVHFLHLSSLHYVHQNPEGLFRVLDMVQDCGDDHVHSLDISYCLIVFGVCLQNLFEHSEIGELSDD